MSVAPVTDSQYITTAEACEILSVHPTQFSRMKRHFGLHAHYGVLNAHQEYFKREEILAVRTLNDAEFISNREASEILRITPGAMLYIAKRTNLERFSERTLQGHVFYRRSDVSCLVRNPNWVTQAQALRLLNITSPTFRRLKRTERLTTYQDPWGSSLVFYNKAELLALKDKKVFREPKVLDRTNRPHPLAKLTNADVRSIRNRYASGEASLYDLSVEYDVSMTTVHAAIHGERSCYRQISTDTDPAGD